MNIVYFKFIDCDIYEMSLCLVIDAWYASFKVFNQSSWLNIKIINSFGGSFDADDSSYSILSMFDITSIISCVQIFDSCP